MLVNGQILVQHIEVVPEKMLETVVVVESLRKARINLDQFGSSQRHPIESPLTVHDQRKAVGRPVRRFDQPFDFEN